MRVLIVDDERLARNELRRLLSAYSDVEVAGEAANGEEAIARVQDLRPDLLFLDVRMPGISGFEVLEALDGHQRVIFTTAFDHFAIRAFEVNALDYLLKPVEPERLDAALQRARSLEHEIENPRQTQLTDSDRVFVKDGDRCWFVRVVDVALFESEGNYTRLYFDDERPLVYRSLSYLEEKLTRDTFFRASRKHLVNLEKIKKLEPSQHGGLIAHLEDGHAVEMSRRQAQKFRDQLSL